MEVFNTQDVVSCLLAQEYDIVDCIFVTMIIGRMTLEDDFKFEDQELTESFLKLVDFDGFVYKLKKGIKLDTNISPNKEIPWTVKQAFSTKKKLYEYLERIDLQKIVDKKVQIVGADRINDYLIIFSKKERKLLPKKKKTPTQTIPIQKKR